MGRIGEVAADAIPVLIGLLYEQEVQADDDDDDEDDIQRMRDELCQWAAWALGEIGAHTEAVQEAIPRLIELLAPQWRQVIDDDVEGDVDRVDRGQ